MSIQYEGNELEESEASRKRRWLVVALLFLVTLGGSVAARLAAETNPNLAHVQIGDLTRKVDQKVLSFDGRLDRGAVHVGGDGLVHLELIATGGVGPTVALTRRPTDVVVVLDRSGSMAGDPMAKALAAIRELVGQLGPEDRFGLVTYSNGAEMQVPLALASAEARKRWSTVLDAISSDGGTNMPVGLDLSHSLVTNTHDANRV
jgi:Mg-chelatase subunit ChlD